jgi:hypothetical protein
MSCKQDWLEVYIELFNGAVAEERLVPDERATATGVAVEH